MITERDLVQLPFTRDLTEAGLAYARRVLLNWHAPVGTQTYDRFRRIMASAALHLAFRRYLATKDIPFAVQTPPPFLDPDRYDLQLGGRTCELKTFLISRESEWQSLLESPQIVLDAPALVPLDRDMSEVMRANDVYVFGVIGAAIAKKGTPQRTTDGALEEFWLHCLPEEWRRVKGNAPLGPLSLKAESADEMSLELGGLDTAGNPAEKIARLVGGQRLVLPSSFIALSHVGLCSRPKGRVGMHLPVRQLRHVIGPGDWDNVWLHGWGMLMLGWISRQEFRDRAQLLPAGRRVLQFDRTQTKNLAVTVSHLRPISELAAHP